MLARLYGVWIWYKNGALKTSPQSANQAATRTPALFGRHVPIARQILRKLLDGHILCEPIEEGGKPGYRFTATGTFDRLLTGENLVNHGGGGEPIPKLFCASIRVPLRPSKASKAI